MGELDNGKEEGSEKRAMSKKANSAWVFKPTEIGQINRKIEKSVSDIVTGSPGAVGETIRLAKERERIILSRTEKK